MCNQQSLRSAYLYAQSQLQIRAIASSLNTISAKHHLEFLSLKRGCTGLSESTHVKMPHCWLSHVKAHIVITLALNLLIFSCSENFVCLLHKQHKFKCFPNNFIKEAFITLTTLQLRREQSDLSLYCLQYRPPKFINRRGSRWQLSYIA